jgi:hypothetical protein
MPRWQRVYLTACAGVIGHCLGYTLADYAHLPRVFHVQLERRFVVAEHLSGAPSGYVGLWLWALAAGVAAAGTTWLATRVARRPMGTQGLGLAMAWALTAFVGAGAYFTWHNWP